MLEWQTVHSHLYLPNGVCSIKDSNRAAIQPQTLLKSHHVAKKTLKKVHAAGEVQHGSSTLITVTILDLLILRAYLQRTDQPQLTVVH